MSFLNICLSAQAQAEETLNTLHFASMALRVKCNPLCILDPQDKLVLNLRGTISKLRSQNQQLSTALQRSRSHSGDGSDRDPEFEHEPVSVLFESNPNFEHEPVSVLFECDPDFEHEPVSVLFECNPHLCFQARMSDESQLAQHPRL